MFLEVPHMLCVWYHVYRLFKIKYINENIAICNVFYLFQDIQLKNT